MKKIAIILPYLKAGGTERQAYYLAENLSKNNNITIITVEDTGAFKNLYNDFDINCLNVKFRKSNVLKMLFKLIKVLKKEKYDLVVSRAWNSNALTSLAALMSRTPYVVFLSGSSKFKINPFKKFFQKFLLEKAKLVISVSKKAKQNCIETYNLEGKNIKVVQNGIDIDSIKTLSEIELRDREFEHQIDNKFVIMFIGRLNYRKGLDLLLEAIASIKQERDDIENIKLVVIGTGELTIEYKELVRRLDIEKSVLFKGEKNNPFNYLKKADMFVFPSRSEGFPNVLLEAMTVGIAPIATDCETGPAELIEDNENGMLVETENVDALKEAIIRMYENPELRKRFSKKAVETIYNKHNIFNKMQEIEDYINRL